MKYKGHDIETWEDERRDPREDDNATEILCFHKKYDIGDKHDHGSDDFENWNDFKQHIMDKHDAKAIKPLYMYDHSGQTISTEPFSCRWDSGQIGWVFVTNKTAEENGWDEARCLEVIEQDIKYYDRYVQGECAYGFTVTGPVNDDSCGGYDDEDDALESAKSTIDATLKHLESTGGGATVKYLELLSELTGKIDKFKSKIEQHSQQQQENPGDWGFVGDIGHWNEVLNELI